LNFLITSSFTIFVDHFVFIEEQYCCDRNLGRTTPQKTSHFSWRAQGL